MSSLVAEIRRLQSMQPVQYIQLIPVNHVPLLACCYEKPYNEFRRAKLILFGSCFNEYEEFTKWSFNDKFSLITKLERSCFNASIIKSNNDNIQTKWDNETFKEIYHSICYKISSNITKSGSVINPILGLDILHGNIDIAKLPNMTSQELFPGKYKALIDKLEQSKNVVQTIKTSSMHKCRRCHKTECTIENRYNRSLDEGVNLTVTCVACGFQWNA